jgi:hypothetical protein
MAYPSLKVFVNTTPGKKLHVEEMDVQNHSCESQD